MDATILFADVSGSHKLIERAGNAVAHTAIARCIDRLRKAAESTGGRVVKAIGDEVMVLFDTPDAAVEAAVKMHASIDSLPAVSGTKLAVQVGFHSGPVIQVERDVLGDTVNLAAKLVEQAQSGQTVTSQQTAALLSPALQPLSRQLSAGDTGQEMPLCEIVPLAQAQDHAITRVRLTFRNFVIECSRERSSIVIGRDYRCGLVVMDPLASREHCTVAQLGDQFVLRDHSSNGTYVTIEHENAVLLKGQALRLRRYGLIGFSEVRLPSSNVVQFSCA